MAPGDLMEALKIRLFFDFAPISKPFDILPVEARSAGGRAGLGRGERERREDNSPMGELRHNGTRKTT